MAVDEVTPTRWSVRYTPSGGGFWLRFVVQIDEPDRWRVVYAEASDDTVEAAVMAMDPMARMVVFLEGMHATEETALVVVNEFGDRMVDIYEASQGLILAQAALGAELEAREAWGDSFKYAEPS